MSFLHGTYVGPHKELKGLRAMLRDRGEEILAQFDERLLVHPETMVPLGFLWHVFPAKDFNIDKEEPWNED